MPRDKVDRSGDPGESEFGGAPDDKRLGIVPDNPGNERELLSAYWTDPNDPDSQPDNNGDNIGDTGVYR